MNFSVTAKPARPRWIFVVLLMVLAMSLASCGMFGDKKKKEKQPTYYAAKEVPVLTIPDGLDQPNNTTALVIQTPPAPLPDVEPATVPPRVLGYSNTKNENASVRWGTSGIYLFVADSQNSVNRRLGYAVKRSGINYRQAGDNSMIIQYFYQADDSDKGFFSKMAFWRDDGPDYSGEYLITTEADGENTRIYLKNADGSDCPETTAEHLLIKLDERLG